MDEFTQEALSEIESDNVAACQDRGAFDPSPRNQAILDEERNSLDAIEAERYDFCEERI